MRRIFLLLCFLMAAGTAFSISGRVFMHFGSYNTNSPLTDPDQTNVLIGPMFSYWGVENNVDLWQGKDGTGFEINFDSFSILYKTREAITIPGSLDSSEYQSMQRWGQKNAKASSPGYIRFQNLRIGNAFLAPGFAVWALVGSKDRLDTNSTTTNNDYSGNVGFVKGYVDFKFDIPFNENITLKINDWDLMWLEAFGGSSTLKGNVSGTYRTNTGNAFGFKIYCPPHLLLNMDQFQLDFSPKIIFDNSLSNANDIINGATNSYSDLYYRLGAVIKVTYNFDRVFGLVVSAGYYNEFENLIAKTNVGGSSGNIYNYTYTANIVPLYAGLKITVNPSIGLTLGYGMNLTINNNWKNIAGGVTSSVDSWTVIRSGYLNTWLSNGVVYMQVPAERQTYGDSLMDLAFLRFGATVKIMSGWEMGMAAAVSLNDAWTREFLDSGSKNTTYSSSTGTGGSYYVYNWLSFLNWMNYDNNMYLKFETDTFIAKLTFDMFNRNSENVGTMMGMFGYLDFTYKF